MNTIFNEFIRVMIFVWEALIHIWPLLLISIPLSVVIKELKVSHVIDRVFKKNIWLSILLATLIGAVAPFCSCSVVPIISALLTAGVPIAPVMSFWLASPSMDPEIFFLSVGSLGWGLAVARIVATFLMSLIGGIVVQLLFGKFDSSELLLLNRRKRAVLSPVSDTDGLFNFTINTSKCDCNTLEEVTLMDTTPEPSDCKCSVSVEEETASSRKLQHILSSMLSSTWFVVKFLIIAYVLEALIKFYVPIEVVTGLFGGNQFISVVKSSMIGIPLYTTNLSALGIVAGMMSKGLSGGAGLAFLIGGATTTIPAMAAVYKLVDRRIFIVYLAIAMFSSVVFGWLYNLLFAISAL